MKNKKLLVSLLALSFALVGCQPSSSSSNSQDSTSSTSSGSSFNSITNIGNILNTYSSRDEYNFAVKFKYSTVTNRVHSGTFETDYQYEGKKLQLTYEADGAFFTDYFYEDEAANTYEYYIDMGEAKEYQLIDGENEYYFQFTSQIDKLDLCNIDWEDYFLVNEDTNTLIPADPAKLTEAAKHIFGDKANEYWEELEIKYNNDKYISEINAISIYRETVYYYTLTLENHSWVTFDLPETTGDYVGNQPYYKNEEYKGIALTEKQKGALEFLSDPHDANYTVNTLWEQVILGSMTGASIKTQTLYADGQAEYKYTDVQTNLTYTDYLIEYDSQKYAYYKDNADGTHTPYYSGTQEYENAVVNYALDQFNLAELNADDFIYNEEKGYIMPKDKETEYRLVGKMFGYKDNYFGLHIYLKDNVITKVETSLYMESGTSIASYKKTYTVTNIGTTVINYPSDVKK